jgi:hypothetical protein
MMSRTILKGLTKIPRCPPLPHDCIPAVRDWLCGLSNATFTNIQICQSSTFWAGTATSARFALGFTGSPFSGLLLAERPKETKSTRASVMCKYLFIFWPISLNIPSETRRCHKLIYFWYNFKYIIAFIRFFFAKVLLHVG